MKLPNFLARLRPDKAAFYGLIGIVAVVVGSYATWKIISLFAPQLDNSGGGTTVILKVSDHSLSSGGDKLLLPNSLTEGTRPFYNDDINSGPTPLLTSGGPTFNLFRIQGEIQYK